MTGTNPNVQLARDWDITAPMMKSVERVGQKEDM